VLFTANGELVRVDVNTGGYKEVKKFDGYVCGMDRIGDYLFVCMSKTEGTIRLTSHPCHALYGDVEWRV